MPSAPLQSRSIFASLRSSAQPSFRERLLRNFRRADRSSLRSGRRLSQVFAKDCFATFAEPIDLRFAPVVGSAVLSEDRHHHGPSVRRTTVLPEVDRLPS